MRQMILAFAALFSLIAVQGKPAVQDASPSKFSVSVNLVKVPISVFDKQGNLVTLLKSEDFRVWEDKDVQQIRSFGLDTNPVSVVLLVDMSMSEKKELKKIKEAAEGFVSALSPADSISLICFDDRVNLLQDWTSDLKKVRKAIGKIRPGWRTALYDAMYSAADNQLKEVEGRKAIILLTDCLNNESSVGFRDASQAIVQSQASFYVVSKTSMIREEARRGRQAIILQDIYKRMFPDAGDYFEEYFQKKEAEMSDLAEKTGGRCFFPADYNQIKGAYDAVARELKSKYFLTYVSNQILLPNSYHRIAVEYLGTASRIIYRKGYYYQPQPVNKAPY